VPEQSAGVLLHRSSAAGTEVLLVHPGGPFWARKDDGAWTIPKGLREPGEAAEDTARREFAEETGGRLDLPLAHLGSFRQPSGKIIDVFTARGDFDPSALASNTFLLEWPPRTGTLVPFPEVDRAAWLGPDEAFRKIVKGQRPILEAFFGTSP
jgi:predicted NUDIX family NTP pyrophosphohydrolase